MAFQSLSPKQNMWAKFQKICLSGLDTKLPNHVRNSISSGSGALWSNQSKWERGLILQLMGKWYFFFFWIALEVGGGIELTNEFNGGPYKSWCQRCCDHWAVLHFKFYDINIFLTSLSHLYLHYICSLGTCIWFPFYQFGRSNRINPSKYSVKLVT